MLQRILYLLLLILFAECQIKEGSKRYDVLLNMVYHNPGEPNWETQYTEPAYLKAMGYTGQVPKMEVQCGLTYDMWKDNFTFNLPSNLIIFWLRRRQKRSAAFRYFLFSIQSNITKSVCPISLMYPALVVIMSRTGLISR